MITKPNVPAGYLMVDEFAINYARKIWPSITKKTRSIIDYGRQRTKYTIIGLMGTETIDLIDCNEARFAKWGYAPRHNMLICILDVSPSVNFLAKWDETGWSVIEPPSNDVFGWTPTIAFFIKRSLAWIGNWLNKLDKAIATMEIRSNDNQT